MHVSVGEYVVCVDVRTRAFENSAFDYTSRKSQATLELRVSSHMPSLILLFLLKLGHQHRWDFGSGGGKFAIRTMLHQDHVCTSYIMVSSNYVVCAARQLKSSVDLSDA